jgi:phytoene dehydrogenase-like protein
MKTVVVGGGLAGLVAARHLADAGAEVQLFERRDEVGGRVRSVHERGYTFDRGFQVLFTAYPAARRELDYEALDLRAFAPGATIARPGHRSTLSDPLRDPGALTPTLFNRDVRTTDLLRLFRLQRRLRGQSAADAFAADDRDVRTYLAELGFSRSFVENFAAPFYGGITLDRSLSTSAAVFEYTFRMLSTGRTVVPAEGMGAIPRQLADRARETGVDVELGREVSAVDPRDGTATLSLGGETVEADAVVVATDPPTAGDLTGVETPTDGRGCVTQYLSLPGHVDLDTDKRIVLNAGDDRPNTVAPLSAVAPEYAPDDRTLLSATFLGGETGDDRVLAADDETLAREVRDALAAWYPERRFDDAELVHTDRIPFAQFAQPPGFRDSLPAVTAPEGPVYLAGDYTAWSSIQGALESGRRAAEAALHGT